MNELVELWASPASARYLIAGWRQWADAGSVSSGLPRYLIERARAAKIGRIHPDGFYLFQIPGAHDLLRPVVRLSNGHREQMRRATNEFFFARANGSDFLIFLGDEPHRAEECYAEAFLDTVEELGIERVAAVAGVHGPVPYDKHREVSCVYSLPEMRSELARYAVRFSNYEGGATISMYLAHRAEARGIEFFGFCALVPSYSFSTASVFIQRLAMEEDYRAWHELMRRLDHMFGLGLDLSDLESQSEALTATWAAKIDQLARTRPQLGVRDYMEQVNAAFTAEAFDPLSDIWGEALRDVLEGDDEA